MTADQLLAHLRRRLPDFEPAGRPERLSGGLLNYVWRVAGRPAPVVVKEAPPFVAASPGIPLDPGRVLFEARSLAVLGPEGRLAAVCRADLRPPRLLDVDEERHVLVMEDVGARPDLGAWLYRETAHPEAGGLLGGFIGRLHRESCGARQLAGLFNNAAVQQTRHAVQYRAVEACCRRAGLSDAAVLGARAVALGERLLQPGRCLIQGDLWPASVLVPDGGLRVIDWEFAHYGDPAQDVGHLAAHLWMHAHRAPAKEAAARVRAALFGFLETYAATVGAASDVLLGVDVVEACAVHFGAEVLVRTVGAFQSGYLYDGLPPEAPAVQEAVAEAAAHLRAPGRVDTFAVLAS